MRCPYCRHPDSRVVDSREHDEGQVIRRRRSCQDCGRRFTTVEEATLAVIKRSGVTEPFSRLKVVNGVRRACQGRPVDEDALAQLAQAVEEAIRATGAAEVPSDEVGLAILGPLRELDQVAYLRFASVYKAFSSIDDFDKAISELRGSHQPEGAGHGGGPAFSPDGLTVERVYTTAGVHPYDEVSWERRDVVMTNWRDGSVIFEQRGVEFPDFWSVNAANIVTTKYFRGAVGTPQREHSLKQLVDR